MDNKTVHTEIDPSGSATAKSAGAQRVDPVGQLVPDSSGSTEINLTEHLPLPERMDDPNRKTIHAHPNMTRLAILYRRLARLLEVRGQWLAMLTSWGDARMVHATGTIGQVWAKRPWRQLTGEERMRQDEIKRRKALKKILLSDAHLYWDRMVNALDRRGFTYRPSKDAAHGGVRFTQHVTFDRVKLQPEAIYYRLNTNRLPYGVSIMQLMDEELLVDLSIACGRRVSTEYSERLGAWYIIERALGKRGLPEHVMINNMLEGMPASADGLTIPIGMGLNAKPIYRSLGRMYSMLVAGTIGGGKSNFLNVAICTLIRRNSPERLRIVLVDLKGGLEFQFYDGIPHLISVPDIAPSGIADKNEQVPGVLRWLHTEGERRMELLRAAEVKNIGSYNAHKQNRRLPHLLLVIDEWADVMYNRDIRYECEETLANVAQRYRAVGLHVILCTQIPKTEVISTRIKGVLPAKLAFSVPSNAASMVIIDNGAARQLSPSGRAIFQWDDEQEVQTPFIGEPFIDGIVQGAISGHWETEKAIHDVSPLEVMEWSIGNDTGWLSVQRLYQTFGKRGLAQDELETWLQEWEGQEFIIGTSLYRVDPARSNQARRLVAVDENADDLDDTTGERVEPSTFCQVRPEDILKHAAIHLEGELNRQVLYDYFRHDGLTMPVLDQWLTEMEGDTYSVGGHLYDVLPAQGNQPRRMESHET